MGVITRFAPSPTGYLHIGSARTALFNWLFARHNDGMFLLRIEDTDKKRSTEAAITAIHEGLNWLNLKADEPVVMQSTRISRHVEVANELLKNGSAYRCYLNPEELENIRSAATQKGKPLRSPWRNQLINNGAQESSFVVRMRMPDVGSTTIIDNVQGPITVQNSVLDDMIILRADSSPTYTLAVVVDDHDMGITHIIRGDDHLNNAFRQFIIYKAMGWTPPEFAHIPLIHGNDGSKLSKRHGALGIDSYKNMGILPDAMFSYLLRLGWSWGDEEVFTRDKAVELFDLSRVGKSPARFDLEKLENINSHFLKQLDNETFFGLIGSVAKPTSPDAKRRIFKLAPLLKERAKTHVEIAKSITYLIHDGPAQIIDGLEQSLTTKMKTTLLDLDQALAKSNWKMPALQNTLNDFMLNNNLKMRDVGPPLRAVLTGRKNSASIIDIMAALGQSETSLRIRAACEKN